MKVYFFTFIMQRTKSGTMKCNAATCNFIRFKFEEKIVKINSIECVSTILIFVCFTICVIREKIVSNEPLVFFDFFFMCVKWIFLVILVKSSIDSILFNNLRKKKILFSSYFTAHMKIAFIEWKSWKIVREFTVQLFTFYCVSCFWFCFGGDEICISKKSTHITTITQTQYKLIKCAINFIKLAWKFV